jgi:hypothetical protein
MRRTGKAVALFGLLFAAKAFAEVDFYQTVDKNKVGTEDTFRLTIVVGNAPDGATVQFPAPNDFEVLSRSQSTEMSYQLGNGGTGSIKRVQKYTLVMRANRVGNLKIPPAVLATAGKDYKTDAVPMEVVKGRLAPDAPPPGRRGAQTPFGNFPFPNMNGADDDDPFQGFFGPEPEIPRSDSDIFLRSALDKETAYVGEQVTLTLTIYSRVDLASVDSVTMPKLEGFWSEDVDSPSQLAPEARVIGGVQYRAYLLRRRALFPNKAGTIEIDPAEADLTTGYLFRGSRLHRKGNALTLKVKPLPKDAQNVAGVGRWRLSREATQTMTVPVNTAVQVRVMLEGRGNLKSVTLPKLVGPRALRIFDPMPSDKTNITHGAFGGKRTQEYTVLPQQTGTFTLPAMTLRYFNPETAQVEESTVDPITLNVVLGNGVAQATPVSPSSPGTDTPGQINQLPAGGLRLLRTTASFTEPPRAVWSRAWFLPMAVTPFVLSLAFGFVGLIRRRGAADPAAEKKRKAREARARLAAAEKLRISGKTEDFYVEVEKALNTFLEARLSTVAAGLTRAQLDEKMTAAAVAPEVREKVKGALDTCDMGRFAPGMGDAAARVRALDQAAQAMEAWDEK